MSASPLRGFRVLLGVSSSIAAYRALDLASMLRKAGAEVRCVVTPNTLNLVGAAAFDAITHQRTITSLWGDDHAGEMDHLSVTKWADLFVIFPATANTIATLAHGMAQDALGTFALAWNKRPLLIAPAMNPEMWKSAATQANVRQLKDRGHEFAGPVVGSTACDDVGEGRLIPVEEMFQRIEAMTAESLPLSGKRVLVTAGPTREFADDVRCVTNPSTGKMGIAIAEEAKRRGAEVVLVLGPTPLPPPPGIDVVRRVISADDMLAAVLEELQCIDIAVFSAAVSDWKPADRATGKMKKQDAVQEMEIRLVRTPDIAATANEHRKPGQVFVGFAAESADLEKYGADKIKRKGFDLVFANPVNESGAGFGTETNRGVILRRDGTRREIATTTKKAIAGYLLDEALSI